MLISELISMLEKVKEQEGDLEVTTVGEFGDVHTVYGLFVGYDDYREVKDSKEECEDEYANKIICLID